MALLALACASVAGACATAGAAGGGAEGGAVPLTTWGSPSADAALLDSAEQVLRAVAVSSAGAAAAVFRDGAPVWLASAGYADLEARTPVDSLTRFRIYSVVKPMTAAAALRLAASGRLDPAAPVHRYVSGFPSTTPPVTPLQLGTHTSGIRHYADEAEARNPGHCATVEEALPIFAGAPLVHEPGTAESYSSWGFVLLSAVVSAVEERPFPAAMRELVFEPAGMEGMALDDPRVFVPHRATPYERSDGGRLQPAPDVDNTCKWGAGGFVATAEDLARFGAALASGSLVSERGLQMFLRGSETYTASGIGVGGTAFLRLHVPSSTVIVVLSNTSGAAVVSALQAAIDDLDGLFLP